MHTCTKKLLLKKLTPIYSYMHRWLSFGNSFRQLQVCEHCEMVPRRVCTVCMYVCNICMISIYSVCIYVCMVGYFLLREATTTTF